VLKFGGGWWKLRVENGELKMIFLMKNNKKT